MLEVREILSIGNKCENENPNTFSISSYDLNGFRFEKSTASRDEMNRNDYRETGELSRN